MSDDTLMLDVPIDESPQRAARRLLSNWLSAGYRPAALHAYTDRDGTPVFWRLRCEHPSRQKLIRPMRRDASGRYELGEPTPGPHGKLLYRLHEIAAARPDDTVVVCEGEKAVDALVRLQVVATTSGGAGSASAADWTPLRGRQILVWPDFDEAGARYADEVALRLSGIASCVHVIDATQLQLPEKGDAYDWAQLHPSASAADVLRLPRQHLGQLLTVLAATAPEPRPLDSGPDPLPDELPPVEAFAPDLLPDTLRDWAVDIAERVSCPLDFVAIPAMLAACTALGRKIAIRPQRHTDWTVVANLWGLIVGRPGTLKSPALAQALAPLRHLALISQERYEHELSAWKHEERVRKLVEEAAEKKARAELSKSLQADVSSLIGAAESMQEPLLKRYSTSNATMEALAELLRQNPWGMLLERDEVMGLLRGIDRPEQADYRAFLLEAWDGNNSFTIDRIGRGFNLHIPAMCLSIVGTTQPSRLQDYVSAALYGGVGDDGLIQRFSMACWPDPVGDWKNVDRWPDSEARRRALSAFERLDAVTADKVLAEQSTNALGLPDGPPYLRFDDPALDSFLDWRTKLEDRLRSAELHPALESHLSKYRKLVPALALVSHLADGGQGAVTQNCVLRAAAWAHYLESHAHRIFGAAVAPEVVAARAILNRIKRRDLPPSGFSSRDVWRPGWSGLRDRALVAVALDLLVELGWLAETLNSQTGGRPSTAYTLSPQAKL